jgi:pyruvate kinase
MRFSAPQSTATSPYEDLLLQFESLYRDVQRASECADVRLSDLAGGRRYSLENLHAYLALRAHDLRPVQQDLQRLGLASLEHAEPHVLATLRAILTNLYLLDGQRPDPAAPPPSTEAFAAGPAVLVRNTDRLFGPPPEGRRARIMITLPDEAAEDWLLLQSLLKGGMDCARINCAYGDQTTWSRLIQQLRDAESATGRSCRLFMDLRGPKLRTGRMEMEPAVLRIRPLRAGNGRVLRPARIWLTDSPQPQPEKLAADASLLLDDAWWRQAAPGDWIRLRDARGSNRNWRVSETAANGCWAESRKTTYVANGTLFDLQHQKGQTAAQTGLESLPPRESRVAIRAGDFLYLVPGDGPGKPSVHDLAGELLRPATIPLDVPEVFRDARAGESVGFDDGRISGVIEQADSEQIKVRIMHTRRPLERLSGDKGVNLPETALDLPALGDEDLRDLEFLARRADIIGLSFTNGAADVRFLHQHLQELGRENVGVIFKLETRRGCANLSAILLEAMSLPNYGVMIARGDLAAECGFEGLAELQDDILRVCEAAHVPVTVATGVLEGLARRGHPVRAEITDAAMAQRAECVMLGKGSHITTALNTLDELLCHMQAREHKQRPLLGELPLFRLSARDPSAC